MRIVSALFVLLFTVSAALCAESPSNRGDAPRKVVIGTVMWNYFVPYPGLEKRLAQLDSIADSAAWETERAYPGRGLDLLIYPEEAVTCGKGNTAAERAVPLRGAVLDRMGAVARRLHSYVVVPLDLAEEVKKGVYTNAAVLLDRTGKVAGIYRKVHPVAAVGKNDLEDGITPGREFPVFDCDFGRIGIQICFDMTYRDGWDALARKGAEIVVLTTMSPQTVRPAAYALEGHYYVVSSTPRENATFFNPVGMAEASISTDGVLVHMIDLSYAIIDWAGILDNGKLFTRTYGDRAGYCYSTSEDAGVFWSNDPAMTIRHMVRDLGLVDARDEIVRIRHLQDNARGGPPEK